jgi:type I restriction enzyme, S subunit
MANEWKEVALTELADLSGGFAFKSGDYAEAGRFVLRTLNIADDGSISKDDAVYLPEQLSPQYARFELQPDDTLFVMVGATLGKVGYVRAKDLPALLNQNMWLIRARPGVADPRYVHYSFRHFVKESLGWASGSARSFLRRDDTRNLRMPAPPLPEQRAIAHILGTLDDKIELNRKQNETLEAMARTLFKAWFVDFEPVHAKQEGRWQRGQSLPGLPAHLYDLFPNQIRQSEFGEAPDGWKYAPLRELASIISKGTTPTKDALKAVSDPAKIYYLKVKDIAEDGEVSRKSLELIPSSIHESVLKRSILRIDDLLFSIAGTIGRVAIVDKELDNSNCNQAIAFVRLKDKANFQSLCWLTLRSKKTQDFVESKIVQGVQANASLATIGAIPVLVPTDGVLSTWNEFVRPLMQELNANQSQSRIVTRLRETLLPKLISGELRVPDAERIVGAAV